MMNIGELVEKYYASWARRDMTITQAMASALTEQAEAHAMELRAYEATVHNLEHFAAQQVIVDYRGCEGVYDSYEEFQDDWEE